VSSVVDASALLASLYGEPGADMVDARLAGALMSAVNAAEVIAKLAERGMAAAMARDAIVATSVEIVPFDLDQAELAGALRPLTRSAGLSLGDRACLALAKLRRLPALTAERAWSPLADVVGVEIVQIRRR
jgi:PIN domain nuclease of toxin-antitoxin system